MRSAVLSFALVACTPRGASTPTSAAPLPRQCGHVEPASPDSPDVVVCPRGWSACLATTKSRGRNPHHAAALRHVGASTMPTVVWRDVDQDGIRDGEARYRYDRFGNVTSVWSDSNGNGIPEFEARNTYDARGLMTEAWSDNYYDATGPLRRRYKYNAAGWLTFHEETVGDAAPHIRARYTYDANGWMRSKTTGNPKSETHYERDAAGNLLREWSASWEKRYSYDANGRVTRMWGGGYEERRRYDVAGRVVQVSTTARGGTPAVWNQEYDEAGRVIRSWSDTDGDGKPESETHTTYDAAGRTLAVAEDRDGDGRPEVSHGTDYTADGQPARRWRDTNGDGRRDHEVVFTYDADGLLVREVMQERDATGGEVLYEYKDGKLVRVRLPANPDADAQYTYDASGNVSVAIGREGATHYEYDNAALAALRKTAPTQCVVESAPIDATQSLAMALDPPREGAGWLEARAAAPGRVVAPKPPMLPALDARGYVSSDAGSALDREYAGFLLALRAKAFADRGWKHVPIHTVPAGTSKRYIKGVRVEEGARECGERTPYLVDRQNDVFVANVEMKCQRTVVVKVPGSLDRDGCGVEPPAKDLYAEVADGGKLVSARSVPITVPICITFAPDQGFSHPP